MRRATARSVNQTNLTLGVAATGAIAVAALAPAFHYRAGECEGPQPVSEDALALERTAQRRKVRKPSKNFATRLHTLLKNPFGQSISGPTFRSDTRDPVFDLLLDRPPPAGGFSRAVSRHRRESWLIRTLRGGGGTSTVANGRPFGSAPSLLASAQPRGGSITAAGALEQPFSAQTTQSVQSAQSVQRAQSVQSGRSVQSMLIAPTAASLFDQAPAEKPLELTDSALKNFLMRVAGTVLAGGKGGETIVPATAVRHMLQNLPRPYLLSRGLDADCTLRISCTRSAAGRPLFLVHSNTADLTELDNSQSAARWAVMLAVMGQMDAYMANTLGVDALFLPDFRDARDLHKLWGLWDFQFQYLFLPDLVLTEGDEEPIGSALSWRGLHYSAAALKVWFEIRYWAGKDSDFLETFGSPRGVALMQCILTSIVDAEEDHLKNYAPYIPTAYFDWARVLPLDDIQKGVWLVMAYALRSSERHSAMLLFPDADHVYNSRIAIFTDPDLRNEITASSLAENGPPERLWVVPRNAEEIADVRAYELRYDRSLKANQKDDIFAFRYKITDFGKECVDLFTDWGDD